MQVLSEKTLVHMLSVDAGPELASVKAQLARWLPKTDAPPVSIKAKRKKDQTK